MYVDSINGENFVTNLKSRFDGWIIFVITNTVNGDIIFPNPFQCEISPASFHKLNSFKLLLDGLQVKLPIFHIEIDIETFEEVQT